MNKSKNKIFDLMLFKKVMRFSRPYKFIYYLLIFSAISLSIFSTISPYLLKLVIDDYIVPKNYDGFRFIIFLMFLILVFEVIFQFIFIYYANWFGQKIIKDIRVVLFKKILNFKMSYFDNTPVGRLVTRSVSDIEVIASIFSQGLFMIVADFLKMGFVVIIMLVLNWQLSLIVFSILPIIIYATKIFQKSMKRAFEDVRTQVANLNSFVQERINGIKIVKLFSRENIDYKIFNEINNKHKKAWLKTVWYNSIFFPVAEISTSVTIGLLVWYGGLQASLSGAISIGTIFLFIRMSQMLFQPLRQIADKFNTLQMGMVAANRVFNIIEKENKNIKNGKTEKLNIKGSIEIKNLFFSYNEKEEVLKGINFSAKPGEKVAIVGSTGAGKSTIINLISRFYEFKNGDILIDDISIKKFKLQSLRRNIALVLQDVFLFADTIHNNISLFDPSISRKQIIKAAKDIGVHDFINSLPNNYDYNVKERGVMLSSGQRQLIAFLRAYVTNPSILILDEATSSIDANSEELIQRATSKISEGKTSIIIAHRLSTIRNADKIIVLDKGNIIEVGDHNKLIANKSGFYYNLFTTQYAENKRIKEISLS
ncbi:MAG: ABC transporter ATP-binding protein [Flavobacteriaceae bacterium]